MKNNIAENATVMNNVTLGVNVTIGNGALIYPNVVLGDNVFIGAYCIVGEPSSDYYTNGSHVFLPTEIGKGSIIRSHTVIYENVKIGESFQTGHHITIREKTTIGNHCSVGTLSDLQGNLEIGNHVRIHSNVHLGQLTIIEDYAWIYPYVVTTNDPYPPVGEMIGCHIGKYAIVATGTIVLPGTVIGENALVAAGSVVTKDVEAESVVIGVPAKAKGLVREIKDKGGNTVYPWSENLKHYRGYPWQVRDFNNE